jgi:hypothetical protein
VLVRLIQAAKRAGKDSDGRDIRGAAEALREYGALALWVLPVHGLFVPNVDRVSVVIDRVAKQQFGLDEARRELREALKVVDLFEHREPIESAINHVRSVSDEAHFYAGVAFGATLTDFS